LIAGSREKKKKGTVLLLKNRPQNKISPHCAVEYDGLNLLGTGGNFLFYALALKKYSSRYLGVGSPIIKSSSYTAGI